MKREKMIMKQTLYPPKSALFIVPLISFAALIFIFVYEKTESMLAYPIYCMSAYSLTVLCAAVPNIMRKTALSTLHFLYTEHCCQKSCEIL